MESKSPNNVSYDSTLEETSDSISNIVKFIPQVKDIGGISPLKLMDGFEPINVELCVNYMSKLCHPNVLYYYILIQSGLTDEVIWELYSAFGNIPSGNCILDVCLPQYLVNSPPFLFDLSNYITPENKFAYASSWFCFDKNIDKWTKLINEHPVLSSSFFTPSIPLSAHSHYMYWNQ